MGSQLGHGQRIGQPSLKHKMKVFVTLTLLALWWPWSWGGRSPSASLTRRTWTSTAGAGASLALRPRLSAGDRATAAWDRTSAPNTIASKGGMAAPSALGRATDRTSTPQKMPSSCYFVKDCNVTLYILLSMPL